jgi:hypothetical protein
MVTLICFVIVFPALASGSYGLLEGDFLPMRRDRFDELLFAWGLVHKLVIHIGHQANYSSTEYPDFQLAIDARFHIMLPTHPTYDFPSRRPSRTWPRRSTTIARTGRKG